MTNKEAVIELKKLFSAVLYPSSELVEAEDLAIGALGSISQIMWERNVALEQLKMVGKGLGENMDNVIKRTAIKPQWKDRFMGFWVCGCETVVDSSMAYCPQCGSKLDWSEENDE